MSKLAGSCGVHITSSRSNWSVVKPSINGLKGACMKREARKVVAPVASRIVRPIVASNWRSSYDAEFGRSLGTSILYWSGKWTGLSEDL